MLLSLLLNTSSQGGRSVVCLIKSTPAGACGTALQRICRGHPGWHAASDQVCWGDAIAISSRSVGSSGCDSRRGIVTGYTQVPRAQHDRYRTPPKNYVQLLQHIARSRDVLALSLLVKRYGRKFDAVHVAAALSRMPRLYQPGVPGGHLNPKQRKERRKQAASLLAHLQLVASPLVPRMFARQVAAITYALSRCDGLMPHGSTTNPTTQRLLHSMLARVTQDNGRLLWQGASGPSVSFLLHGLARIGYAPATSSSSSEGEVISTTRLARTTNTQLCKFIARHPERLHVRELAAAGWALGRLHRRRPGSLVDSAAAGAAMDAISREVQQRKLYLRPASMAGLAAACAWLGRRDTPLLAAIAEEAVEQQRSLRPVQLALLAWAAVRLKWAPPPELLAAVNTQAARQLRFFSSSSLGLLLQSMRRLGAQDEGLLAAVAAGIAAEEQVVLAPLDAARILAAFVAAPRAGAARDVEGMAERIGAALARRGAFATPPGLLADLLVCYSKLPYHHPVLLRLLQAAGDCGPQVCMGDWVKLLQSAARLGYGREAADPAVEAQLAEFYEAADARLQQHLRGAALPAGLGAGADADAGGTGTDAGGTGADAAAVPTASAALTHQPALQQQQQQQQQDDAGSGSWWQRLGRRRGSGQRGGSDQAQAQAAPSGQLHPLQFDAAVDLGLLLSQRGALSTTSAAYLADVGVKLLPVLKLRKVWQLLTAVTARDGMFAHEDVRRLLVAAVAQLQASDLSSSAVSPTVLVGMTVPVARALARNMVVGSGEALLQSMYEELLPSLDECSQAQVLTLWEGMRHVGPGGDVAEALRARAKALAAQRGWSLTSESGFLLSPRL